MSDRWYASRPCRKCKGVVSCQRWGDEDIRITCEDCGNSFMASRKNPNDLQYYTGHIDE